MVIEKSLKLWLEQWCFFDTSQAKQLWETQTINFISKVPHPGDIATTHVAGGEEGNKPGCALNAHASGWVGRLWQSPFCFLPMPVGGKETGFLLDPYPGKRKNHWGTWSSPPNVLLGTWCGAKTWGPLLWGRRRKLHFSDIRPWHCLQLDYTTTQKS